MIVTAWLAAVVFALPQTLVFRVLKHPKIEFYQCTSMDFFRELMLIPEDTLVDPNFNDTTTTTTTNNTTTNGTSSSVTTVMGLGPDDMEKIYSSIFLVAVYMVPLSVIVVTYANILAKIVRKRRQSSSAASRSGGGGDEVQGGENNSGSGSGENRRASNINGHGGSNRHLHRRNNR